MTQGPRPVSHRGHRRRAASARPAPRRRTPTPAGVRLTTISARVNANGASLVIEATEPVAYVATRPDPLTVLRRLPQRRRPTAWPTPSRRTRRARSPACRSKRRSRWARRPSRVRDHAGAAGRAPRAQRPQHDRHRLRQAVAECAAVRAAAARRRTATGAGAGRHAGAAERHDGRSDRRARASTRRRADRPPRSRRAMLRPVRRRMFMRPAAAPQTSPPPQPPVLPAPVQLRSGEHRARRAGSSPGNPISLDFQGADLRAVLRTFSEISGLNIVIDPAVQGTVDVALRDVPWDQALDIILRANKLGYLRRRHDRPDRAARRCWPTRRRSAASWPRSRRSPGELAGADQDAQLRESRGPAGAADQERAVAARHRAGRPAHQHAHHHRPARSARRAPAI